MTLTDRIDPGEGRPLNALILDDSEVDRLNLLRLCDRAGLSVKIAEAADLPGFENQLAGTSFDLVFIDYRLADGTGLDALHRLTSHPDQAGASPIMIAGEGQVEIAVEAMRQGCLDYITKESLTVDVLRKSIATAIEKRVLLAALGDESAHLAEIETAFARFVENAGGEMRAIMAAMLRRTRNLRNHTRTAPQIGSDVADLERSCADMFAFIEEFQDAAPAISPSPRRIH